MLIRSLVRSRPCMSTVARRLPHTSSLCRAQPLVFGRPLAAQATTVADGSRSDTREDFLAADLDGDGKISFEEFQAWQRKNKPTIEVAQSMPREFWEMSNEVLLIMAARGNAGAQRERMVREVMAKTPCSWEEAQPIVEEIRQNVLAASGKFEVPYYTNLILGLVSGVICVPLIFHLPTVEWFNENFVTMDVPATKDLETSLEVSSWAWNWMEPVIGTVSFILLVCQFSRAQMLNIGMRPYGRRVFDLQVARLQSKYPHLNAIILEDFLVGTLEKQTVLGL